MKKTPTYEEVKLMRVVKRLAFGLFGICLAMTMLNIVNGLVRMAGP